MHPRLFAAVDRSSLKSAGSELAHIGGIDDAVTFVIAGLCFRKGKEAFKTTKQKVSHARAAVLANLTGREIGRPSLLLSVVRAI